MEAKTRLYVMKGRAKTKAKAEIQRELLAEDRSDTLLLT